MEEEKIVDPTTEKKDDGGETGEPKTSEKSAAEYKQMFEDQRKRAEKAEAREKDLKSKIPEPKPVVEQKQINAQVADPDELRLIARGLSDNEIEQLQVISKGKGLTLMESLKDPLFISFQKDLKEQEKKEKAKLGGSNSSNQGQEDEEVVKSGMTVEEHREAWNKVMKGK